MRDLFPLIKWLYCGLLALVICLPVKAGAYETISGSDAYDMYMSNPDLVVVDVREDYDFCAGHVGCADNLPYNSGVFRDQYDSLASDAPILLYCASGFRSSSAAAILDGDGYSEVYSLSGGFSSWPGESYSCSDVEDCESSPAYQFYFPHVASGSGWETEIGVVNTDSSLTLEGVFQGCDANGVVLEESSLSLPPAGRLEFTVGSRFTHAAEIKYLILETGSDQLYGYLKFYGAPQSSYRVAIPAPNQVNENDIYVSHIATTAGWWTGLGLVNTNSSSRTLTFEFNNGESKNLTIPAGAHSDVIMSEFMAGLDTASISSAVIKNGDGIVGLEIFGNGLQLGGILLRDSSSTKLYFPHIANDNLWWTGIAAFNPGLSPGEITLKPYNAAGELLDPATAATIIEAAMAATPIDIAAGGKLLESAATLDLPAETAWLALESTVPLTGFELFGTTNGRQLAGYTSVGIENNSGVFAKLDDNGWTGIALVNIGTTTIQLELKAYRDSGELIAATSLPLAAHARLVDSPENIFGGDISAADYIVYSSGGPVVAFQLNGDGDMLDALPGYF